MYETNLIAHLRAMRDSAQKIGAQIKIDFASLNLEISKDDKYFEFFPVFGELFADEMWLELVPKLSSRTAGFAGWRLLDEALLPLRNNRVEFKQFCDAKALATPKLLKDATQSWSNVLIKEITSARRGTIHGPMSAADAFARDNRFLESRYVEEYIDGDTVQAWYVGGQLACVERRRKPSVVGDGRSTVRDLISRIKHPQFPTDVIVAKSLLQTQGLDMETVPPSGQIVNVDLRFSSALQSEAYLNENLLREIESSVLTDQLRRAGKALFDTIPMGLQNQTVVRLDGVVDSQQKMWFTDVGPKTYIHPDVYSMWLPALFEVNVVESIAAPRAAAEVRH
jgi:hypothetical protein